MASFAPASHLDVHGGLPHQKRRHHPWLIAIGVVILAVVGLGILGASQQPTTVQCTQRSCTPAPPTTRHMLTGASHYTSSSFGYSVDYSTGNITPANMDAGSIAWDATLSDNSEVAWSFHGIDPQSRDAQQIVADVQQNNFPDANLAYVIPGADLGYTPGYGTIYDLSVAPGGGAAVHERLIIIAAVKHGVGVVFVGMGPYQRTTPQSDGHPNPADTPLVSLGDFEQNITSVTWKGDPPL